MLPQHLDPAPAPAGRQGGGKSAGRHAVIEAVDDVEHGCIALERAALIERLDVESNIEMFPMHGFSR